MTALSDELSSKIKAIQTGLDTARQNKDTEARSKELNALNDKVTEAKKVYRSFKVELRELSKAEAKELEAKSKEYNTTLNKLGTDIMAAKVSGERGDLMAGASGDVGGDEQTEEQIRAKMDKTAAESLNSTERSLAMLEKATKVGTETNQKLQEQSEQMKRIQNDSDKINTHAEKAKKILSDMEAFFGGFFRKTKYKTADKEKQDEPAGSSSSGASKPTGTASAGSNMKGLSTKGGSTVSDETSNQLSDQAKKDVKKTDDNLDKMSDLLGGLNGLATSMNQEVKAQSSQVDALNKSVEKNTEEVQGLTDRTQKMLEKGKSKKSDPLGDAKTAALKSAAGI